MEADRRAIAKDGAADRPHLPMHNGAEAHIAQEYLLRYYNIQKLTSKCEAGYRRDEAIQ